MEVSVLLNNSFIVFDNFVHHWYLFYSCTGEWRRHSPYSKLESRRMPCIVIGIHFPPISLERCIQSHNKNSTAMPKQRSTTFECRWCRKLFGSVRALSMHLYHNINVCRNLSHPVHAPQQRNLVSQHLSSTHLPLEIDYDDNFHITEEDHDDERSNNDFALTNPTPLPINQVFELTVSDLQQYSTEAGPVPHSIEQRVNTELVQLLDKAEAPDYLFSEILSWAARAKGLCFNFTPTLTTRTSVLDNLEQHFSMHKLRPSITELQLESINTAVPIVAFQFRELLFSLLNDPNLMQPDNLLVINNTHVGHLRSFRHCSTCGGVVFLEGWKCTRQLGKR